MYMFLNKVYILKQISKIGVWVCFRASTPDRILILRKLQIGSPESPHLNVLWSELSSFLYNRILKP